jgi:hypothetical protein
MMDKPMNATLEPKSRWQAEPMVWLLIALPVTAVIASAVTIWLAAKNADSLVTEKYVKEGLAVRQIADPDLKAAQLGAMAELRANPGELSLRLTGRFATAPQQLVLTLAHPTDPGQDMVLQLAATGDNEYSTRYAAIPAGKRRLELSPTDRAWRITGQWQAPFTGATRLAAPARFSTQHSSTQP